MPELPEVEILKNELTAQAVGRRVRTAEVFERRPGQFDAAALQATTEGQTLTAARRRGKMLVLDFSGGQSLVAHLMMAGQWLLAPPFTGEPRDVRLALEFTDGGRLTLGQVDLKYVHVMATARVDTWPAIAGLGVDALSDDFTADTLRRSLAGKRGTLKSALTDQATIAGLGNTYVDEILFQAQLHPQRKAGSLTAAEVTRLHEAVVGELRRGLALGGSSEMAFAHLNGHKGTYQERFRVKRRQGKPCRVCTTPIEKIKVGGRGTYFCPQCQKR